MSDPLHLPESTPTTTQMSTDVATAEALPPLPPGLVYCARRIGSEDYITTGGFAPGAPDETLDNLRAVVTLVADCDGVDYLWERVMSEAVFASKSEQIRTSPDFAGMTPKQARKQVMYLLAARDPAKFQTFRANHLAEIRRVLAEVVPGVEPTRIVDSGWGYHVYYWLDQTVTDPAQIRVVRQENERLVAAMNTAAGYPLADPGVHDTGTRILRAVGSTNHKVPASPRPVVCVHATDERWVLGESTVQTPVAPARGAKRSGAPGNGSPLALPPCPSPMPTSLPPEVAAILASSPKLRGIYEGKGKAVKRPDGSVTDVSGSGYDMTLAAGLAAKGVTTDQIAATIWVRNAGQKPWRHAARTAARATAPKASAVADAMVEAGADPDVVAALQATASGPKPSLVNAVTILTQDPRWAGALCWDERTLYPGLVPERAAEIRALIGASGQGSTVFGDEEMVAARRWMAEVYRCEPGAETMMDAVGHVARQQPRNHLLDWLDACASSCDQTEDTASLWLHRYAGVEDTALTRAYARKFLVSAVARAYAARDRGPEGVKVDTVMILQGAQGARKSSLLRALAGPGGFSDSRIDINNKDAYMVIRRPWIYEFAELASLGRREAEEAKLFISSQVDNFRPPYGRVAVDFPRQGVFVGSTNADEFLNDTTGSRRYWPVSVDRIDVDGLVAAREQIWGEAVRAYRAGEIWWLTPEEEAMREVSSQGYQQEDPLAPQVIQWIGGLRRGRTFSVAEVLAGALDARPAEFARLRNSVAATLKSIGCLKGDRVQQEGQRVVLWTAPDELYETTLVSDPAVEEITVEATIAAALSAPHSPGYDARIRELMALHPREMELALRARYLPTMSE